MLYFGECFFIKLFSNKSASNSDFVIIKSSKNAFESIAFVFSSKSFFVKYEEILFFKFFALPI